MNFRAKIDKKRRDKERLELKIREEKEESKKIEERIKKLDEKLNSISDEKEELGLISSKIEAILHKMERNRMHEYLDLINNKKKLIYINFLIGMSRGFGTIIGVTVITALLIYVLQKIVSLNIPLLGDYIADIVEMVQENLKSR